MNQKSSLFLAKFCIFATEMVSVLWLFKTMYLKALRSFLNRYLSVSPQTVTSYFSAR